MKRRISVPFVLAHGDKLVVACVKKAGSDEAVTMDDLLTEDEDVCIIELLPASDYYQTAETLHVEGQVLEFGLIDEYMTVVGVIPDLICAPPGYSHLSTVAAVMATKAAGINGLFRGKVLIDIDKTVLSTLNSIPADANYRIMVTNNAKDTSPVWEDAMADIRRGVNHLFTSRTKTQNFILTASHGASGTE